MKQSQQVASECNENYMEVTYDLAIAKIALQIQSMEKPRFDNLFIHFGSFHIMMAYFKAVGKFIDGCGITNVMLNSEILASGSINSFITGKHFNRCKRLHTLLSLALQTLHFEKFANDRSIEITDEMKKYLSDFMTEKSVNPTVTREDLVDCFEKYEEYKQQTLNGKYGKTSQFYMIYINLIEHYFMLCRSIRTANLDLFRFVLPKIANLFFTFNQPNYSRYTVIYHDKLMKVHETHPGLQLQLARGSFGVRRTDKSFSRQPIDLTLEQTINADAANKLTGIMHTTNSISARQRWCKSHSIRSTIISHIMEQTGLKKSQDITADLEKSRIKRNSLQLENVVSNIKQNINPFSNDLDKSLLYNISTGQAIQPNIEQFLLNVENLGNELREQFIKECSEDAERFEKAIKRNKILTFVDAVPKKKLAISGKLIEVRMQRDLFAQLLLISLEQTLNIDKVLSYPLTPVPLAMCHADGIICKTDKSVLLKILEKETDSNTPQRCDVLIYDGFFMLHAFQDVPSTFGNISKKLIQMFTNNHARIIIVAFDRYFSPSIKDIEHLLRGRVRGQQYRINGPDQVRPANFANELKKMYFKAALVEFLCDHWGNNYMASYIGNKTIYINYEFCYKYEVQNNEVLRTLDHNLSCPAHEEADTKIVFHVCALDFDAHVTIRCSDTDIFVIMLGNMNAIANDMKITMHIGSGNSQRFVNITKLYEKLGTDLCSALPGFHALTGCDFNPAFYRKGKKKPLQLLRESQAYMQALGDIANIPSRELDEVFITIEEFVCRLYGYKSINDVNATRVATFAKNYQINEKNDVLKWKSRIDGAIFPPCKSELRQHLLRTSYIAHIWSHAHLQDPSQLSPTDWGWEENDDKYVFKWFEGDQVPLSVTSITDSSENIGDDGEENRGQELDQDEENDVLQDSSADDSSDNDDDSDTNE
ncbi:unnamed protein product [Pieris macdunnoughi]|uniref:Uncharacterized protein n=1 Tax=Pieris macdunnoughi TaxID=345717 RepID=A0A821XXD1_9NEOP|nr:unnamed protein product [Pieris macdunnoughi]